MRIAIADDDKEALDYAMGVLTALLCPYAT